MPVSSHYYKLTIFKPSEVAVLVAVVILPSFNVVDTTKSDPSIVAVA